MTVQLSTSSGAPLTAPSQVDVTVVSSSASGTFAAAVSGPWSASLTLTISNGQSASSSFYYRDTRAGNITVTATAPDYGSGTMTGVVNAGPVAAVTISPASANVLQGRSQAFTVSATDAYGNAVSVLNASWSVGNPTLGVVKPLDGPSTTFTATSSRTGSTTITVTVPAATSG